MPTVENNDDRRDNRSLVGPVILIALGLVFLLHNFGLLGWQVWPFLARFWPVLLIGWGVDILLGGRRRGLVAAATLVVLAVLAFSWTGPATVDGEDLTVAQELGGANRAEVHLQPGIAQLTLSAGADGDLLIAGNVRAGRGTELVQDFASSGNRAVYSLVARGRPGTFNILPDSGPRDWDLQLNPAVPLDLEVDTGVGENRLDLSGLRLVSFSLNAGVGDSRVTLPRGGAYEVEIDAGVGNVVVRIPEGVAARIRADGGIGGVDVSGEFERTGENTYASPGFPDADERIELDIDGGVGGIEVETY